MMQRTRRKNGPLNVQSNRPCSRVPYCDLVLISITNLIQNLTRTNFLKQRLTWRSSQTPSLVAVLFDTALGLPDNQSKPHSPVARRKLYAKRCNQEGDDVGAGPRSNGVTSCGAVFPSSFLVRLLTILFVRKRPYVPTRRTILLLEARTTYCCGTGILPSLLYPRRSGVYVPRTHKHAS